MELCLLMTSPTSVRVGIQVVADDDVPRPLSIGWSAVTGEGASTGDDEECRDSTWVRGISTNTDMNDWSSARGMTLCGSSVSSFASRLSFSSARQEAAQHAGRLITQAFSTMKQEEFHQQLHSMASIIDSGSDLLSASIASERTDDDLAAL
eukprot:CAMPEP_0180550310 /NCGR_PEP_ID=MMETSP1036_2-20121128/72571_1 /TAXON_ID=632150 /ORGANISM="Azadinium spinosum, Strain 3D9" /LENGTH=150 /DNA_ID=CAMNT_0022565543 /DNA_START=203 /DNA_END=655 /DNA_ORIENTATION=-